MYISPLAEGYRFYDEATENIVGSEEETLVELETPVWADFTEDSAEDDEILWI